MRTTLRYDQLCNAQGEYEKFKKNDSKSELFPFLVNISNINGIDDLNPFLSLTVLSCHLNDRKEAVDAATTRKLTRTGVTTDSVLIDSGAVDSDYISSSLFDRISAKLGNTIHTLHVDTVSTPFAHLPDTRCRGRVSLNISVFIEMKKCNEDIALEARFID